MLLNSIRMKWNLSDNSGRYPRRRTREACRSAGTVWDFITSQDKVSYETENNYINVVNYFSSVIKRRVSKGAKIAGTRQGIKLKAGRRSHEDERSEAISIIYCVLNARRGRNRQDEKAVRVNVTAKEAWNDAAFKSGQTRKRGREGRK